MKKYLFILLMFIVMSCTKSIKDEFRETIIAYQNEFPVPADAKENDTNRIHIYHVTFSKLEEDTVFSIYRTYSKIENGLYEGQKIQEDSEMKPFVITDIFNVSGNMTDSEIKNQYYSFWDSGTGEDKQHTTLYWYKVKNHEIHFWKKDTAFVKRIKELYDKFRFKNE